MTARASEFGHKARIANDQSIAIDAPWIPHICQPNFGHYVDGIVRDCHRDIDIGTGERSERATQR